MPGIDIGRGVLRWVPVAVQGTETPALADVDAHAVLGNLYDKRIEGNVILEFAGEGQDGQALAVVLPGPARTTWVCGSGRYFTSGAGFNLTVQIEPIEIGDPPNSFQFYRCDDGTKLVAGTLDGDFLLFHFNYPVEVDEGIPA